MRSSVVQDVQFPKQPALQLIYDTAPIGLAYLSPDCRYLQINQRLTEICGIGIVTCRFTHVYPDGPAPYFSVFAPGRPGSEVSMWDEIKVAASEALQAHGGTFTHHHAVGRDHDPWYRRQRSDVMARALHATKRELDPAGILNPGVIV